MNKFRLNPQVLRSVDAEESPKVQKIKSEKFVRCVQTRCLSQTDCSVTHAPAAQRQSGRPSGRESGDTSRPLIFNVPSVV